tara:strand:+ start:308 stop:640 length:333 start_codon:yes stop_codon:yes gene_type:complete
MKILNLTPHEVVCHVNDSVKLTFSKQDLFARVKTTTIESEPLLDTVSSFELPMFQTVYGAVENLPEMEENTYLIVSRIVQSAANNRADLLIPSGLVRDDKGNIIGCKGFE